MRKIFGDQETFAIEYELLEDPNEIERLREASWGMLSLWIEGLNISQFTFEEQLYDFKWYLCYIVDWFCDHISYIVGYDPYPHDVKGDNVNDLLEETYKFETNDDLEEYLWHGARSRWEFNHYWSETRGGSVLGRVYFARFGKIAQICWDNEFWGERGYFFDPAKGYYNMPHLEFRKVLFEFLHSIIGELDVLTRGKRVKMEEDMVNNWLRTMRLYS